jgi:predicted amidohydrolase
MSLRAAVVQFFATPFALERNLDVAGRLTRAAVQGGAQVVVLPGYFNTGLVYSPRLKEAAEPQSGPTERWLAALADELGALVGGAFLQRDGGPCFNTFTLAEPGGALHRYRQRHPWLWERCYVRAGREPGLADTRLGRLGLLAGWDIAQASAWSALRGQADLVLVSSAPARLHRAVLNFPEARKVYLADLLPEVLPERDRLDGWYRDGVGAGARLAGLPVASAALAGRFVTALPYARLCFGLAALGRPRYLSWTGRAAQATLRATFYGSSALFNRDGRPQAEVAGEEGWALAASEDSGASELAVFPPSLPKAPARLAWLDGLLRLLGP